MVMIFASWTVILSPFSAVAGTMLGDGLGVHQLEDALLPLRPLDEPGTGALVLQQVQQELPQVGGAAHWGRSRRSTRGPTDARRTRRDVRTFAFSRFLLDAEVQGAVGDGLHSSVDISTSVAEIMSGRMAAWRKSGVTICQETQKSGVRNAVPSEAVAERATHNAHCVGNGTPPHLGPRRRNPGAPAVGVNHRWETREPVTPSLAMFGSLTEPPASGGGALDYL
ncbi:hypothetical protein EYF80_043330 [Liparis tanakae]|uniref:Secreted protein n=1 Tax=Liparis tanakae TaxID=230148 RepID=A0A4Z2G1R9_9TELE|nr:hypothetical protein EYF80_043330 [Liparis tanakae]